MTTTTHPVDSATRPCCGGIGRHTNGCGRNTVTTRADAAMSSEDYGFRTEVERDAYRKGFADGRWDVVSVIEDAVAKVVRENKA